MCKERDYTQENKQAELGNLYWFGLALRDNDMDLLKSKACLINRYPLMDVSLYTNYLNRHTFLALCEEEHLLCNNISVTAFLPARIQLYAPLVPPPR